MVVVKHPHEAVLEMFRSEAAILADLKHFATFILSAQLVPGGSLFLQARKGVSGPAVAGAAAGDRASDCVRDVSLRGGQTFHRD
jgi:hypothetical protein